MTPLKMTQIDRLLNSALRQLLSGLTQSADGQVLIDHEQVRAWDDRILPEIINAGLIKAYEPDTSIACPAYEDACLVPVHAGNGIKQPFIVCECRDDIGRVLINPDRLKRWVFSFETFSQRLSDTLDTLHEPRTLVDNQLFYSGQIETASGKTDIFIVSDITSANHAEIKQSARYILLTLADAVETNLPAINLQKAVSFKNGVLTVHMETLNKALAGQKPASHENILRRDGTTWTIQFQGQSRSVKHTNGMIFLTHLLANPGQPYHVSELDQLLGNAPVLERSLSGAVSDMAMVRIKLQKLKEQIEDAKERGDVEKAETLKDEQGNILKALRPQTGKDGKPRTGNDAGDKARQRVQKAVKTALGNIKAQNQALYEHLQSSIHTGFDCSYRPAVSVGWKFFSDVKP